MTNLAVMRASPIDPRDTEWECSDPAYRVYFWSQPTSPLVAYTSYEWRITDASDVHEVVAWAESERRGRTYELFVEHTDRMESRDEGWTDAPGLIRLAGSNPTAGAVKTIASGAANRTRTLMRGTAAAGADPGKL